jgi:RHS repeat-associated protein
MKIKYLAVASLLQIAFATSFGQITLVKEFTPLKPVTHTNLVVETEASQLNQKNTVTSYDGFGRVSSSYTSQQTIEPGNAALLGSYSKPQYTNNYGTSPAVLKAKSYSSYSLISTSSTVNSNEFLPLHNHFWKATHPEEDGFYYTETRIERSPLARVQKVVKPGMYWVGNNVGVATEYEYNGYDDAVGVWFINFDIGAIPALWFPDGEYVRYNPGKLAKQIVIDEKGKKVITYTDNEGKLILKKVQEAEVGPALSENGFGGWLCTFYVYDDFNQLRCIITPKAVDYLIRVGWVFNDPAVFNDLCFWNNYDERGRLVVKHSPNAGETFLVYDNRDRLVLSQDANQRNLSPKQWSFSTYDKRNRVVATGILQNNSTRENLQTFVNSLNNEEVTVSVFAGAIENVVMHNPVIGTAANCGSCSNIVINSVNYYDNVNYAGAKAFNNNFSFASIDATDEYQPTLLPTQVTHRLTNFITGSKLRVVKNIADDVSPTASQYLTQTSYYSEEGRTLQTLQDNAKAGVDYVTTLYDFAGQVFSTSQVVNIPGTFVTNHQTITKFSYDKIRRLRSVAIKIDAQPFKKLASYTYDLLGRVKIKKLAPDYNGGNGIETLDHSYNIQNWLTAVNKDYALSNANSLQWQNYFGYYLGYENRFNFFNEGQTNGNITGVIWKTQGSNTLYKYNYKYDNANRLTEALFTQKENLMQLAWDNSKMDFSVTDILYDKNGNLVRKHVKGILPGTQSPVFIDKLSYSYGVVGGSLLQTYSNKLTAVIDNTDLTATTNGQLGDFKNENFGVAGANDYEYDANGNLVKDNNKKIRSAAGGAGIVYNFLNRPLKTTIQGKSIVEYTYDAAGSKLAKKITNTVTNTSKTIWYLGSYLVEEVNSTLTVKEIYHPEGRIKVYSAATNPRITKGGNFALAPNVLGTFEYFVKDHLQNTRVILTEETHNEYHNATMETAAASYEEQMFGQVNANGTPAANNEVVNTRITKTPQAAGWASNSSQMVSKLSKYSHQVGPNALLKVMAGDNIGSKVDYYYDQVPNNPGGSNLINSLVANIANSINVAAATTTNVHGAGTAVANNLQTNTGQGSLQAFIQNQVYGVNAPQAYLNIIFFDENFNFVSLGSTSARVTNSGDAQSIPMQIAQAPKNGYAFVYVSNESVSPVFFDNLEVYHTRGRLVEENTYYPHGLKIKAMSAKAFDAPANPYQYQGDYAEFDEETGYNEFELRDYDPQLGRFIHTDPYEQFASGYVGMGGDPVNMVDPSGGWVFSAVPLIEHGAWAIGGAAVGAIVGGASNGWNYNSIANGALIGGGVGLGASFVNWDVVGGALGDAGRWLGGLFQQKGGWILEFTGTAYDWL